jgi:hypothetical protein
MVRRSKAPGQPTPRSPRKRAPQRQKAAATDDVIRERAYELFERRGGEPGHELEDWLTAERELRPGE